MAPLIVCRPHPAVACGHASRLQLRLLAWVKALAVVRLWAAAPPEQLEVVHQAHMTPILQPAIEPTGWRVVRAAIQLPVG